MILSYKCFKVENMILKDDITINITTTTAT